MATSTFTQLLSSDVYFHAAGHYVTHDSVCACVRACVRACVLACVRACVCVCCVCVRVVCVEIKKYMQPKNVQALRACAG